MIAPRPCFLPAFLAASLAMLGLACTSSTSSTGTEAAAGDPDAGKTVTCQHDPRVDTYAANLAKGSPSGGLEVTLVASEPAPPVRGLNKWTIKVSEGGSAVSDAALTITPFMPDHGHGTSVTAVATANGDGTYTIPNVYLFMPGVWRVTIEMPARDGGAAQSVPFFFCIPG